MTATTRIGLLDPFGGLAGDMLLGALIDVAATMGDPIEALRAELVEQLASLALPNWSLRVDADDPPAPGVHAGRCSKYRIFGGFQQIAFAFGVGGRSQ
ncbi:MAG: LarC family nickel insertion protein, partial [Deltaproteobacteria bacterium]|nr:LarC family nickel insertion protein [Deltaproteobacteria bacterium]